VNAPWTYFFSPVGPDRSVVSVVKHADGTVYVTIRELRDPAGLQRTLRADGIPASVTFSRHTNPACRPYRYRGGLVVDGINPAPNVLVFRPSDLPAGAGWQIVSYANRPRHLGPFHIVVASPLTVQASPQCTGS
jgi:hypothetical protein